MSSIQQASDSDRGSSADNNNGTGSTAIQGQGSSMVGSRSRDWSSPSVSSQTEDAPTATPVAPLHPLSPELSLSNDGTVSKRRLSYFRPSPSLLSIHDNRDSLFKEDDEDEDEQGVSDSEGGAGSLPHGTHHAASGPSHGSHDASDRVQDTLGEAENAKQHDRSALVTPKPMHTSSLLTSTKALQTISTKTVRLPRAPHLLSFEDLEYRLKHEQEEAHDPATSIAVIQELSRQVEQLRTDLARQERLRQSRETALLTVIREDANSNVTEGMLDRALTRASVEAALDPDEASGERAHQTRIKSWKISVRVPIDKISRGRDSKSPLRKAPLSDDLEDAMSENDFREAAVASLSMSPASVPTLERQYSPKAPPAVSVQSLHERRGRKASQSLSSKLFGSYTPSPFVSPSTAAAPPLNPSLLSPSLPTPHSSGSSTQPSPASVAPITGQEHAKYAVKTKPRAGSVRSLTSNASTASKPSHGGWTSTLFGWRSSRRYEYMSDDAEDGTMSIDNDDSASAQDAERGAESLEDGSSTDRERRSISTKSVDATSASSVSSSKHRGRGSSQSISDALQDPTDSLESAGHTPTPPSLPSPEKLLTSPNGEGPIRALMERRMSNLQPEAAQTSLVNALPSSGSIKQLPSSSSNSSGLTSSAMLQSISSLQDARQSSLHDLPTPTHFRAISDSASTIGKSASRLPLATTFRHSQKVSPRVVQWTQDLFQSFNPLSPEMRSVDLPLAHDQLSRDAGHPASAPLQRARSPRLVQQSTKAHPSPATLHSSPSTMATVKLSVATPAPAPVVSPASLSPSVNNTDEAVPMAASTTSKPKGYLSSAKGTIGRALGLGVPASHAVSSHSMNGKKTSPRTQHASHMEASHRGNPSRVAIEPALTIPAAFSSLTSLTSSSTNASPSVNHHPVNAAALQTPASANTVEMGTIVKPEAKPPTLSSDLTDQMKNGPLVDRYGFVYDIKAGMKLLKDSRRRHQQQMGDAEDIMSLDTAHEDAPQVNVDDLKEAIGPSPGPTPALETALSAVPLGIPVGQQDGTSSPEEMQERDVDVRDHDQATHTVDATSNQAIRKLLNQLGEMNESVEKGQKQAWDNFIKKRKARTSKGPKDDETTAAAKAKAKHRQRRMTIIDAPSGNDVSAEGDDGEAEQFSENLIGVASMGTGKQDDRTFRQLVRSGIPIVYRPAIWAEVSGAGELREPGLYHELLSAHAGEPSPCLEQIDMDTHRTFPTNIFFAGNGPGVEKLRRVLIAYSWRDPSIGYCQGMNLLAALLLLVYPDEEDAFWMLASVLERLLPSDYYSSQLLVSQADQRVLQDLMQLALPDLYAHLEDLGVDLPALTFRWFLSLFTDTLPIQTLLRVWDVFLVYGPITLFKIAIAIFKIHSQEIFACDSASSFYVLLTSQTSHLYSADKLLKVAFDDLRIIKRQDIETRRLKHVADLENELAPMRLSSSNDNSSQHI